MIKNKRKQEELKKEEKKIAEGGSKSTEPTRLPAEIRLEKDFASLDLLKHTSLDFEEQGKLMKFSVTYNMANEECFWRGGKFKFQFTIPFNYPYDPPKVHCVTPIYHPNIDRQGNVCLNILKADWTPSCDINACILGVNFLFLSPNPNDPLNHEAASEFRNNETRFANLVKQSLRGGTIDGVSFPKQIS